MTKCRSKVHCTFNKGSEKQKAHQGPLIEGSPETHCRAGRDGSSQMALQACAQLMRFNRNSTAFNQIPKMLFERSRSERCKKAWTKSLPQWQESKRMFNLELWLSVTLRHVSLDTISTCFPLFISLASTEEASFWHPISQPPGRSVLASALSCALGGHWALAFRISGFAIRFGWDCILHQTILNCPRP